MFFLVELIVGHVVNSLALISDSYHMLSDVVAMIIAITSIQVFTRPGIHILSGVTKVGVTRRGKFTVSPYFFL